MKIDKENLDKIILTNQKALVGRVCARIEEVYKVNIPEDKKVELVKNSIRNYIPEAMRDIKFQLDCYNKGLEAHKIEFKRDPTD